MEIHHTGPQRQRAIAYLQRLGIDVWLLKGSPYLKPESGVSVPAQKEWRTLSQRRQPDHLKNDLNTQKRIDSPSLTQTPSTGNELASDQTAAPPIEFTLRWIRRGKAVGIACVGTDTERQLLADMVEYLNDYQPETETPRFRVIKWPLPDEFSSASSEDLSLARAKQFLGQYAKAEFSGVELMLLVGEDAKDLTEEIDGSVLRIEIDKIPDAPTAKLAVWNQMLQHIR